MKSYSTQPSPIANKICLINPPTCTEDKEVYFPMGLLSLGTVLKENDIPFEIVDFDLELKKKKLLKQWHYFKDYALRHLKKSGTQVFGISSVCSNFPAALILAKEIRYRWPHSFIILGGPQPSSVPEETLRLCPWVDMVVIGEGEVTLLELMQSDLSKESLKEIPGLAFRDGEKIIHTSSRALIDDLDTLPIPDYGLVPLNEYLTYCPGIALIEAGRGCPFLCSFCSTSLMWARKFRAKSPRRILEEMRILSRDYEQKAFPLTHDNFTTSRRFVVEFCKYFKENNHENFIWYVSARSDTLNFDLLNALSEAGCRGLFFGVDSGSERIQKVIRKHLKLEQFKQHHHWSVILGMPPITSLIIGFPEETEEDLNETIRLGLWARLHGSFQVQLHHLSPLTGTPVYEENHSGLFFDPKEKSWDFNVQPYKSREIDRLIRSSPRLFSSHYEIPTPHLNSLKANEVAFFFQELLYKRASDLQKLLDDTQVTPIKLFLNWKEWKSKRFLRKKVNAAFIRNNFSDFIRDYGQNKDLFFIEAHPKKSFLAHLKGFLKTRGVQTGTDSKKL